MTDTITDSIKHDDIEISFFNRVTGKQYKVVNNSMILAEVGPYSMSFSIKKERCIFEIRMSGNDGELCYETSIFAKDPVSIFLYFHF